MEDETIELVICIGGAIIATLGFIGYWYGSGAAFPIVALVFGIIGTFVCLIFLYNLLFS